MMFKSTPEISVVIPLYNKEKYIQRTLDSVLAQTFRDLEVIVVNDGSTDAGPEIVRQYDDPRFKLINQENAGVSSARNRGIKEAKAELIAFLDADDEWLPEFLRTIYSLKIRYPEAGIYVTSYLMIEPNGTQKIVKIRAKSVTVSKELLIDNYFKFAISGNSPVMSSAAVVPKKILLEVGLFPIGIKLGEDIAVWSKIALKYPIVLSNSVLAIYYGNMPNQRTKSYSKAQSRFDYNLLLKGVAEYRYLNDLRKYVSISNVRRSNASILNNDYESARFYLSKTNRNFCKVRFSILRICLYSSFLLRIYKWLYRLFK